jgi:hypothetical protein
MDVSLIKKRLDSLQNKGKKTYEKIDYKKLFWKPTVGKQTIRIVPSKFNKQNPFKEVFFHYGIGSKKVMLALNNFGEKDPIVDFVTELKKSSDKDSWKLSGKLSPKMRVFVPVVVRGEEEMGTRLWEFGKEMYMELLSMADDEEIGDYTSITNGRDLTITTVGPEVTGTKYNKSTPRAKMKSTPVTDDEALLKKILEEQPDVLSSYRKYTYEEIKNELAAWLNPEEEVETPVEEQSVETPFSVDTSKAKSTKEDEFDKIFKD